MLARLWWLTFSYGFTAAPHTRLAQTRRPGSRCRLHLLTTFGVACSRPASAR